MKNKIYILLLITTIFILGGCSAKTDNTPEGGSSQPTESADADSSRKESYSTEFSLLSSDYVFHCNEYRNAPTYGTAVDIGNEKIDLMVFPYADIDETMHTDSLITAKELLTKYVFDSIKRPRGDSAKPPETLPVNSEETITINGIEMLKVVGEIESEIYDEKDIVGYTAYFFLDRESPIYVLAFPKVGEKKSEISNFDKDVEDFIQSIEKVSN